MHGEIPLDAAGIAWRLGLTLFFVLLNGFFVATEFALVKVRAGRIDELAAAGHSRARGVKHTLAHMDLYLSACQLGITLASLVLGALGEPAVSRLILAGASAVGIPIDAGPWLRWVSIGLAFAIITVLHMTVGEQAPKMWALRQSETVSMWTSGPLRLFTVIFRPFIHIINYLSNRILVALGAGGGGHGHEEASSVEELRSALVRSAGAGTLSDKQLEIAENTLRLVQLEVRHVMVPRVDVQFLSMESESSEILDAIRGSSHSRLPLCERDLDSLIGFVHGKDVLEQLIAGNEVDFSALAHAPLVVPDTMSLIDLMSSMQAARIHLAQVIDEHGTTVGLAFREDVLEEIVGPLGDEFDSEGPPIRELSDGCVEFTGGTPLPDMASRLEVSLEDDEGEETVAGFFIARIGRFPIDGDTVRVGRYELTAKKVVRNRILVVHARPINDLEDALA